VGSQYPLIALFHGVSPEFHPSRKFILKKFNKIIFKPNKNDDDFRKYPTMKNLKEFEKSIIKNKIMRPNFFDAKKVHFFINQIAS